MSTSSTFSSSSGNMSKRQAAMKTPPEKHEQKLMKILQRILDWWSWLCLNWEKSLTGSIPNKKVMAVMANNVITFSVIKPTPRKLVFVLEKLLIPIFSFDLLSVVSFSSVQQFSLNFWFKYPSLHVYASKSLNCWSACGAGYEDGVEDSNFKIRILKKDKMRNLELPKKASRCWIL